MVYTFGMAFFLNIPLVLAEYICCLILTYALTKQKPEIKRAVLMFFPYSFLLIIPSSVFYIQNMFGEVYTLLALSLLEIAGWSLTLRIVYGASWGNSLVTGSMAVFLYGITDELGGFFLTQNFNLSSPVGLAAYMVSTIAEILIFGLIIAGIILKCRLAEAYNGFLRGNVPFRHWKAVIVLLPVLKIMCVEIANERLILNNSNPMISLLFLLMIIGVLNYAFRCDMQQKRLQEQQASLEQQKMYIQNLESVQRDVRIFRHDFKNRMAGIRLQADEGDIRAVQKFISEVTGDFEKKVGEKIFQVSQMGNIQIAELKSLLAVKSMEMQQRDIPFRLEAAVPVTSLSMPAGDLCRAVGILLDNAMEETEAFLQYGNTAEEEHPAIAVTAVFCQDVSGVSIIVRNPARKKVSPSRIWEDGYSTKGAGRGTGLASLRRIVETYDNVFSRTYQEKGFFIQELSVGTGENSK
ncbi:MAG TPA: sensor histidine kinase [Candidatus Egerieimonas faecigallinarum]|nr:sensor histidine kinase [Candidatus Egerieimonas faecigallinarum]